MERKTKGLTRGEILVGMEQGVYKDGDKFENDAVTLVIIADRLKYANSNNPVECDVRGYRYDLIEEPAFKVGDWVVGTFIYKEYVGKIDWIHGEGFSLTLDSLYNAPTIDICFTPHSVRLATPEEIVAEKQRRWWAKLGRKVNEYKRGDIVTRAEEDGFGATHNVVIESDGAVGLVRIGARFEANGVWVLAEKLHLVIPAEKRLDRTEATD